VKFLGDTGLLFLMRKFAAFAPLCSMITEREVGLFVLAICVAIGLVCSVNLRGNLIRLSVIRLRLEATGTRLAGSTDAPVPCASPFLAALAPRAPPAVS
jgi:hypothetical protein